MHPVVDRVRGESSDRAVTRHVTFASSPVTQMRQEDRTMRRTMRRVTGRKVVATALLVVLAGCGGDDGAAAPSETVGQTTAAAEANACPVDGCEIEITDAVRSGDEITVTFATNFDPNISRNHIHVYWDAFTADQVSNDAAARDVEQGKWIPTDVLVGFTTEGDIAISERAGSTTLCVTAGDLNHDVIDAEVVNCRDVATLLG
jgi:hypothetical protein